MSQAARISAIQNLVLSGTQVNDLLMSDAGEEMFSVTVDSAGFAVSDQGGRLIVRCHSEQNALNYASLLNEAYKRGYKAGYHDCRNRSSG